MIAVNRKLALPGILASTTMILDINAKFLNEKIRSLGLQSFETSILDEPSGLTIRQIQLDFQKSAAQQCKVQ